MSNPVKQLLEFGPFRVDPEQRLLLRDEQPIPLSPKAFDLLLVLVQRSGQLVLKDDLMKLLWPDTFVEESNLGQHVFQLRKALGERAQDPSYIATISGRGYRFAQKVRAIPAEADEIVVRSRSRMVIEETVSQGGERDSDFAVFAEREQKALSGVSAAAAPRSRIAMFALLAAALGVSALWVYLRPLPIPKVVRTTQITHFGRAEPFSRALTDGSRIYFLERIGGAWSLAQIPEQGGEPILISSSAGNTALYDIDRRRSRLLVATQTPDEPSREPLWVVPTSGGSARRLGDLKASDAAWSPDGRTLVFSQDGELYLVGEDGQQPRRVFLYQGIVIYPGWSPDGKRLTFTVREPSGVFSLWEMGSDGTNPHPIPLGWKAPAIRYNEGECCASWSPDGKYLVFRSIRNGVQSFWLVRDSTGWFHKDASTPVQLYASPDWLSEPRFSADGSRILFIGYQERRELMRYDSVRKLFVPYLGGIPARHLSFSRDGQWVAYKSEVDGTLWRSRVDGTQSVQLTFPPLDVLHSSWSPDGKKIVFGGGRDLYVIPFEGGNPERLTLGTQPSWSPDGRSIVFTRWAVQEKGGWRPAIYRIDMTTREVTLLPGSDDCEGPQWSPDGQHVVVSNKKDQKLTIFDVARQQWSELADGLPYGWGIRWSADSKYVYYQHVYDGEEQPIFRVRVSDRKAEQMTSSRQILRADMLSYSLTGLAPDDSPVASLVHRNSDVYALELDVR